jgi:hypothetical protein
LEDNLIRFRSVVCKGRNRRQNINVLWNVSMWWPLLWLHLTKYITGDTLWLTQDIINNQTANSATKETEMWTEWQLIFLIQATSWRKSRTTTKCSWESVASVFYPEDGGSRFLQYVSNHLQNTCQCTIFTFSLCMLLHLLYLIPTHALLFDTLSHPQFKTPKSVKNVS